MPEEFVKSANELTKSEKKIVRACCSCDGEMKASAKVVENSAFILRDNGILFNCDACDESIVIPSYSSMFLKFITLLMSIGITITIFMNDYIGLFKDMLKESTGFAALAILAACISILLVIGGIFNGFSLIKAVRVSVKHPVLAGSNTLRLFILFIITMVYGFVPWIILGGLGFLNDNVIHIDRDMAIFLVIPGLAPIFVAPKVGISVQSAFFATASYPTIGLIFYFFT